MYFTSSIRKKKLKWFFLKVEMCDFSNISKPKHKFFLNLKLKDETIEELCLNYLTWLLKEDASINFNI